ncbi:MAG: hypothetical protein ACJA1P_003007, partial [Maribacter sp.]
RQRRMASCPKVWAVITNAKKRIAFFIIDGFEWIKNRE